MKKSLLLLLMTFGVVFYIPTAQSIENKELLEFILKTDKSNNEYYILKDKTNKFEFKISCKQPKGINTKYINFWVSSNDNDLDLSKKVIFSTNDGESVKIKLIDFKESGGGIALNLDLVNNDFNFLNKEDMEVFKLLYQNKKISITYLNKSNQENKIFFNMENFTKGLNNKIKNCNIN